VNEKPVPPKGWSVGRLKGVSRLDPASKQKGDGIDMAWDEDSSSKPAEFADGEVMFI
jgi:hypothetical protein